MEKARPSNRLRRVLAMVFKARLQYYRVTPVLCPMISFIFTLLVYPSMGSINLLSVLFSMGFTIYIMVLIVLLRILDIRYAVVMSLCMFCLIFVSALILFYQSSTTELRIDGIQMITDGQFTLHGHIRNASSSFFLGLIAAAATFFPAVIDAYIPESTDSRDE
ncbi:MAG: hypothetical protein H6842_15330 [Rhodospirillaceae bacterium]|jgi:hypothetical protein|nr:hypothetical protein [Rhodospirillaceae bacterium]